ncbi:globin [Galactobacter caseinivorans]|uniref:Globin n=1 Tax=Galactobacter caseinivorans TaxID=2676123 RepID=A0A496PGZ6_9MICC|nr:globin [Galactobacter caseinivorans]
MVSPERPQQRPDAPHATLPEAAAPSDGGPIELGGLRSVGKAATVAGPAPTDAEAGVDPGSIYAQVGGEPTFRRLVAAFYAQVAEDPIMRPMYPEQDLGPAEDRLRLFLIQYFGGPTTYSQERGHPRLRMRHIPFAIDSAARDAWLRHMRLALDEVQLPPMYEAMMWDYFERAATAMVNTAG